MHRAMAVTFVVGLLAAAGCGSSSDSSSSTTTTRSTSTTVAKSTSTGPTTSGPPTTTATSPGVQPDTAVWPFAESTTRYTDPAQAAKGFAVTYLGFVDPVVGEFQQGDSRSGEVAVKASATGPTTTVLVRKLAPDDTWWVLGSHTANLTLQSPAALASIASPVTLSGQSTAFEATVNVEIRQDGALQPLVTGIVMGGSNGEMGPFSKAFPFTKPTAARGAIILKTMSAKDGNIAEASVVRVQFS